jgi:hypothetical protein
MNNPKSRDLLRLLNGIIKKGGSLFDSIDRIFNHWPQSE